MRISMKKLILTLCALLILTIYVSALPAQTTIVKLDPAQHDRYNISFINRQDVLYQFPYVSNLGGTFKYGDDDNDLVFIEGNFSENMTFEEVQQIPHAFNIGLLDYFVLSNVSDYFGNDETAVTHVIRYNFIDTSDKILRFDEEGSGRQEFSYELLNLPNGAALGKASLYFGGDNYTVYIGNATSAGNDHPLAIDMNADGVINRAEIRATTLKGNILDFGNASESDGGTLYLPYGWSNIGGIIRSNDTVDFTFLTKRRTIGHLPLINQPVITHIQVQEQNTLNITSVEGRHFTLLPPEDHKLTPYRFFFKLSTGTEGERLAISYRQGH